MLRTLQLKEEKRKTVSGNLRPLIPAEVSGEPWKQTVEWGIGLLQQRLLGIAVLPAIPVLAGSAR